MESRVRIGAELRIISPEIKMEGKVGAVLLELNLQHLLHPQTVLKTGQDLIHLEKLKAIFFTAHLEIGWTVVLAMNLLGGLRKMSLKDSLRRRISRE